MTKSSTEQDQNDNHPNDNVAGTCRTTAKTVRREALQQRSSKFRGVTRHRWTGRYEAHLWDKNCWNDSQKKKGRQVYLGAYDDEEAAAHAYDLAALKYWGNDTFLNFPLSSYNVEVKVMEGLSREEYIGSLRRKSSGFSRGVSKYRGVARHHHNGRWEARIGRVFGNKYLYLGTYATQEEAATAYDMAAIEYRGLNAVTNFDLSRYIKWIRPNTSSSTTTTAATTMIMDSAASSLALASQEISQNADDNIEQIEPSIMSTPTTSSAIGLFFKPSDFEEIFEKPTSILSVDQPPLPTRPCHFPEDIQTYFECQDSGGYDGFEDVEGILGGLRHTGCLSEYDDVFAESLGLSCEDRPHQ